MRYIEESMSFRQAPAKQAAWIARTGVAPRACGCPLPGASRMRYIYMYIAIFAG
jgi:hypothetical protein